MAQLESREIGQRIAQARREAVMTQEEVSDLLGVTTRSVQGYEAGEVIPYRHFKRLEEIFGHSIEWFLHGEERMDAELMDTLASRHDEILRRFDALDEALRVLATEASRTRSG